MPRHLIHVGFPKCGSTALQEWFAANPAMTFAWNGLAGHSGVAELSRCGARPEDPRPWHVTSFELLVAPRVNESGPDISAGGPMADRRRRVCELLRELFGEATILIVTRGFRTLHASVYSQYVRAGGTLSLRELMSGASASTSSAPPVEEYFDYDEAIALYESVFRPEHVIVMPYELLREDPSGFIATLEERLGLECSGTVPPWVNQSLTGAELVWYPRFARAMAGVSPRLGPLGRRLPDRYRARVRGGRLRRPASVLARLTREDGFDPSKAVPAEALERCRGRAALLVDRPEYASYRAEYLG
jgi:hypothetical protein